MADYVKLANPQGTFYDSETKLAVSGDDVAELIEPLGRLTKERLRHGGLVRCGRRGEDLGSTAEPGNAKDSSVPASLPGDEDTPLNPPVNGVKQDGSAEPDMAGRDARPTEDTGTEAGATRSGRDRETWVIDRAHELEGQTVKDLRAMADDLGVTLGSKDRKADIATAVADALWQQSHEG